MTGRTPFVGISEFTTMPWSFERDVQRYAAHGVGAIEIVEAKLDHARLDEQFALVRDAGLAISGVQPAVRTFLDSRMMPQPRGTDERIACLRQSIETLAPHCPDVPFITNTGAHPKGDMADAMRITEDALRGLAPVAADHGVRLALEPLNPTSVNVESAIWTIDQALAIIEGTGRDEVGLCLDYWNIWQQADVVDAIARAGDRIFTAQASDWRTLRPAVGSVVDECMQWATAQIWVDRKQEARVPAFNAVRSHLVGSHLRSASSAPGRQSAKQPESMHAYRLVRS